MIIQLHLIDLFVDLRPRLQRFEIRHIFNWIAIILTVDTPFLPFLLISFDVLSLFDRRDEILNVYLGYRPWFLNLRLEVLNRFKRVYLLHFLDIFDFFFLKEIAFYVAFFAWRDVSVSKLSLVSTWFIVLIQFLVVLIIVVNAIIINE